MKMGRPPRTNMKIRLNRILTLIITGAILARVGQVGAQGTAFTKPEVARHFGITVRTLENWMTQGYVPYLRFGRAVRFILADVQMHVQKYSRVCRFRV